MKNLKGNSIFAIVASVIACILMAIAIYTARESVFVNRNANKLDGMAAKVSVVKTEKFDLTNVEVIKKASELLGTPYSYSKKGYNGNIYENTYNSNKLYSANEIGILTDGPSNNDGIDCSGLVYWTLSSLAKEKGWNTPITTGFSYNNPVPVDCTHWLTYGKNFNYWSEIAQGGKSIDEVAPKFNGKTINVLKKNDSAVTEEASSGLKYYQYKDENGNVNNLPSGTIIISYNKGTISNDYDHAWIYIGDLGTSDPAKAKEILEGMGITGLEVGKTINQNGNSTHWRIESAGNVGVNINNGVPSTGTNANGKTIGNIWAFQVASSISGNYEIQVEKVDSEENIITSGYEFKIKDGLGNYLGTNTYTASISKAEPIALRIAESVAPSGYVGMVGDIGVNVNFKYDATIGKYIVDADNTKLVSENANVSLRVDNSGAKITVTVKNKEVDLALKKIITHINGEAVSTDLRKISVDTSSLNNGANNAVYTMNKTPIKVNVGDIITYELKIYNEGKADGFANGIRDYIPTGLEFISVVYNGEEMSTEKEANYYTYNSENQYIDFTFNNPTYIKAYDGQTISSDTIIVKCKVKEDATGVLTNVAEITSYMYGVNRTSYTVDIDSTADNWMATATETNGNPQEPTTADKGTSAWKNYANGNQSLLDGNFHNEFLAQDAGISGLKGDDDDFEKVLVMTDYDFSIEKIDNNSNTVDGIEFEINRTIEGVQNSFSSTTQNGGIITDETTEEITTNGETVVEYTITEVNNSEIENLVQLDKQIDISIVFSNGKLSKYVFVYGTQIEEMADTTKTYQCQTKDGTRLDVTVEFDKENNKVNVVIENKYLIDGNYGLRLKKISASNGNLLSGVIFKGTKAQGIVNISGEFEQIGDSTEITFDATSAGTSDGYTNILTQEVNSENYQYVDKYVITEINLGSNTTYTKLESDITVLVHKKRDGLKFVLDYYEVTCGDITKSSKENTNLDIIVTENGVTFTINVKQTSTNNGATPIIDITVPNVNQTKLNLWITKTSAEDNSTIKGTKYDVFLNDSLIYRSTDLTGCVKALGSIEPGNSTVEIKVMETKAADGYDNVFAGKYILLTVTVESGVPTAVVTEVYNENGTKNTEIEEYVVDATIKTDATTGKQYIDLVIKNPEDEKIVDLALKKIISEVNGRKLIANSGYEEKYNRLNESYFKVNTQPLQNGKDDAEYYLNKTPIILTKGAKIKYQLRIYNEGYEINSTASKIKDYIPEGLKLLNVYYKDEQTPLKEGTDYTYDKNNNVLNITVLNDKNLIEKFNMTTGEIAFDYVTVECEITNEAEGILTNVAEITEYKTEEGILTKDRDSEVSNWKNPNDGNTQNNNTTDKNSYSWQNYLGDESNKYTEGEYKNYIGQEDDDDFEKVKVVEVDLVLKKIITKINDTSVDGLEGRFQRYVNGEVIVDTEFLDEYLKGNGNITTAQYLLNKTPINVRVGDLVTYEIRIYNEGQINAIASEITDYIPKGMDLVSVQERGGKLTKDVHYTIDENNVLKITALKNKFLGKYEGNQKVHYNNTITVTCRVNGDVKGLLSNVAEITKYQTIYGELATERDSTINNWEFANTNKLTLEGKYGVAWARYAFNGLQTGKFVDYLIQEDDDDFEKVRVIGSYSLGLRKVSSKDNSIGLENVEFKVNNMTYKTDENGNCLNLGTYEMADGSSLNLISIEEVSTNNSNYIKLRNPISIGIIQEENDDGSIEVWGYRINCTDSNMDKATQVRIIKIEDLNNNINVKQYIDNSNKTAVETLTFYAYDVNDNVVKVKVTVSGNTENDSNIKFDIQVENEIKNSSYNLYLKKVDENGNPVDGVEFSVTGSTIHTDTTKNGIIYVGYFPIVKSNYKIVDNYQINEIKTLDNYFELNDSVYLKVFKGLNSDKTNYEVTAIKLICNGEETEEGKLVELKDIEISGNKSISVTAKVEGENVIITIPNVKKEFDLSLRKFITQINKQPLGISREPRIDLTKLRNGESTTAEYIHPKDVVGVSNSDIVTYTIRVFNEGEQAGYASKIMDDIPEGLEFVKPEIDAKGNALNINAEYKWKMYKEISTSGNISSDSILQYNGKNYIITNEVSEADLIVTDYLSMENGVIDTETGANSNLLIGFDVANNLALDYKDVKVEFKVIEPATSDKVLVNSAQITDDSDSSGNPVDDRDSTPNEWIDNEDDQDIEKVELEYFDLALRKFITDVNGETVVVSRQPEVDVTKIASGESTTADYTKVEEPIEVNNSDIVAYTIRVYNEGETNGYASRIMDDIPDGLEFVACEYNEEGQPLNLNAKYGWVMYEEVTSNKVDLKTDETLISYNGKTYVATEDVTKAALIVTNYLSMENGVVSEETGINSNLIKGFDAETMDTLDYRDVKVAFKVKEPNTSDRIIINSAQITEDIDEHGNPVVDIDSTPNVWIDKEDDQDIEKIRVRYFDLALYKWVSRLIVTEDGKTTEYLTGHSQEDKSKAVVYSIPKDSLDKITIKYKYIIKVENQGEVEGYAKEIKDHVPAGMKFIAEDNAEYGWVLQEDGTITTDYLKDTLLKKGETAQIPVVLTWINNKDNLGQKVNFAEISEDYNEYGDTPDIDSTPNNFINKVVEDDEDGDVVMLQIRTGTPVRFVYALVSFAVLCLITAGVIIIKKFVLI